MNWPWAITTRHSIAFLSWTTQEGKLPCSTKWLFITPVLRSRKRPFNTPKKPKQPPLQHKIPPFYPRHWTIAGSFIWLADNGCRRILYSKKCTPSARRSATALAWDMCSTTWPLWLPNRAIPNGLFNCCSNPYKFANTWATVRGWRLATAILVRRLKRLKIIEKRRFGLKKVFKLPLKLALPTSVSTITICCRNAPKKWEIYPNPSNGCNWAMCWKIVFTVRTAAVRSLKCKPNMKPPKKKKTLLMSNWGCATALFG